MIAILDHIAKTSRGKFRPSSPDELFALRLAHHLGEPETAAHYALLLGQYTQDKLLAVYRKTISSAQPGENLGAIFHYELGNGPTSAGEPPRSTLLAIRLERRSLAAAVFSGTRLKSVRLKYLPSGTAQAQDSAAAFIGSMLADFEVAFAAIEHLTSIEGRRRPALQQAVCARLSAGSVPTMQLETDELLAGLGYPAIPNRRELREIAASICPLPNLKPNETWGLDAVALGLFVQAERLFTN